jgi:hypothetical protein
VRLVHEFLGHKTPTRTNARHGSLADAAAGPAGAVGDDSLPRLLRRYSLDVLARAKEARAAAEAARLRSIEVRAQAIKVAIAALR